VLSDRWRLTGHIRSRTRGVDRVGVSDEHQTLAASVGVAIDTSDAPDQAAVRRPMALFV
jgi:hypothetical protein